MAAEQAAHTRAQASKRSGGKKKTKSSKQEGLFKQVGKAIRQLAENPRHSSLNTHEYSSLEHPFDPRAKVFEAYAQNNTPGAYRIFWCYGPEKGVITIIAITPHP
ncbi:MAG: type II toxin-antitoxin system RelE family toxin [Solirubrobacteraceae bacterium]